MFLSEHERCVDQLSRHSWLIWITLNGTKCSQFIAGKKNHNHGKAWPVASKCHWKTAADQWFCSERNLQTSTLNIFNNCLRWLAILMYRGVPSECAMKPAIALGCDWTIYLAERCLWEVRNTLQDLLYMCSFRWFYIAITIYSHAIVQLDTIGL